jgi:hypothetical protein
VNRLPVLNHISLSDADRADHLTSLYYDVICRLCRVEGAHASPPPIFVTAIAHGRTRQAQGYSAAMLVEESRLFEIVTFGILSLHRREFDQSKLLLDIAVIADEVDTQLTESVRSLVEAQTACVS